MGKKERKAAEAARLERESARAQPILDLIEAAFDGVAPPDAAHRTLHQAEAWDDYRTVDQRSDHQGRWQDLPEAHLRRCPDALHHLDEQGILYYLPALLVDFVRHPGTRGHGIQASLLYTLQPAVGDLKDYQRQRFSLLTAPQREAILRFLELVEAPEANLTPWRRVVDADDGPDWFRRFY